MTQAASRRVLLPLVSILIFATAASASSKPERTQFGHDIRVDEGETVADVTCFGCNVYVRGQVSGDVTVFGGNVTLGENVAVSGDVTVFMGDARLGEGAKISGDATIFGGTVRRQPGATVSGDVTNFESKPLTILMIASPFIFLGLVIALVVWLVQRNRRSVAVRVSPGGYRS
ncbi:MAG TPA: polymer-forming cytoskeletal protein [Terriglobales bacterium]|nr:polymer-forming cytoskeletal protein [Terriglobales bacterium]